MNIILFCVIVILVVFAMFIMCTSYLKDRKCDIFSIVMVLIGAVVFIGGCAVCIYAVGNLSVVEKNREPLEIESINAHTVNGLQEYIVVTTDGDVYKTDDVGYYDDSYVSVEESETDELELYEVTYAKESHVFNFRLTLGDDFSELLLKVPHEYYLRHTIEDYDNLTNAFSS